MNLNTHSAINQWSGNLETDTIYNVENVTITGSGNATIYGNIGNNKLIGGEGADRIQGGGGIDTITSGGGADTFILDGSGIATVTDAADIDHIATSSAAIFGRAEVIGQDFYQLNDTFFLKEGNDLYVTAGGGGTVLKSFFKSTYDPKADYTFMGITIPKEDLTTPDVPPVVTKETQEHIDNAYNTFRAAIGRSLYADPLVIDTAGNGIALDSWQTSTALFDLNGDGTKENTGWTRANSDDAFLVIDKNNNGKIDNINEMFGNATTAGFVDLQSYDSNVDNIINSTDTQFSLLRMWNDKNANGTVDTGEMTTLAANNITSISLNKYSSTANINGNLQTAISTVTKTDGTTRNIHELAFGFDAPSFSTNPDARLPATFKLNIDSILMPYSRGYNTLYSWQASMTLDPTLLAMAKDILKLTPKDFYLLNDKFENFLFRWAGVENVTAANVYTYANGTAPDPRKIAFMEKISGEDFIFANRPSSALAQKAWDVFFNEFLDRFLVQGNMAAAFPKASYDFVTDTLKIGDTLDTVIANIKTISAGMDLNSFVNYAYYAQNILKLNKSQFTDVNFDAKVNAMIASIITGQGITGFTFDGRLNVGTDDVDILYGTTKNDALNGGDSNDELYGFAGNDYIVGGKGNDILKGEAGNDIYRFSRGDGQDSIDDNAGVDKILLGDGISAADVSYAQVGNDLVINIGTAGDKIGIKNFYNVTTNRVETLEFKDGTSLSLANIGLLMTGTDLAETLTGTAKNDVIKGLGGNDTIVAGDGDDTITGGKGNDIIDSSSYSSGNDTYIFNIGDGQDTITESRGTDQIVFGAGITKANIKLISDYANNYSVIIKIGTNGDQITIKNFFYDSSSNNKVETLKFADGSILDLANGLTLLGTKTTGETLAGARFNDNLTGNIGNDTIYGYDGDDTITGGKGNDIIDSSSYSSGNDTYIFNIGDGQDTITESRGTVIGRAHV